PMRSANQQQAESSRSRRRCGVGYARGVVKRERYSRGRVTGVGYAINVVFAPLETAMVDKDTKVGVFFRNARSWRNAVPTDHAVSCHVVIDIQRHPLRVCAFVVRGSDFEDKFVTD